jgi:hypothetical protein
MTDLVLPDPSRPDLATVRGRVKWMVDSLHDGKLNRLAATIGASGAAISRVLGGKAEVGPRLLEALAAHPQVRADWVRFGLGEPLRSSDPSGAPPGGQFLPVAVAILPGAPADHPLALSGEHYAVSGFHYRPTRYWLRVTEEIPEKARAAGRLEPEDLVLMEADPRGWRDDPRVLVGRLCGLRRLRDGSPIYILAAITASSDTGELTYDAFGQKEDRQYKKRLGQRVRQVDVGTSSEASVKAATITGGSPANEASTAEPQELKPSEETPVPKASEETPGGQRKTLNLESVVALPIILVRPKLDVVV